MKKVYFFAVALFATSTLFSQNDTLTFESYDLNGNDFYNGDDGNGAIVIGDYTLSNYYDATYFYWGGFAISKVQDNTTPGYGNQYASFGNGGANGSSQYAVYYDGTIELSSLKSLKSVQVTNTTYAALSMRDGDPYAKQFGSINGPDGNPDGTNGADWFLLQIIPLDENDVIVGDTINYYLADFRFSDNSQDYILDTWETINLNDVVAKKLTFKLTSSDVGAFGMNTPAYFALDNLVTAPNYAGINETLVSNVQLFPNPASDKVRIVTNTVSELELINTVGQIVKTATVDGSLTLDVSTLPAGMYSVVLNSSTEKSVHKLVIQ